MKKLICTLTVLSMGIGSTVAGDLSECRFSSKAAATDFARAMNGSTIAANRLSEADLNQTQACSDGVLEAIENLKTYQQIAALATAEVGLDACRFSTRQDGIQFARAMNGSTIAAESLSTYNLQQSEVCSSAVLNALEQGQTYLDMSQSFTLSHGLHTCHFSSKSAAVQFTRAMGGSTSAGTSLSRPDLEQTKPCSEAIVSAIFDQGLSYTEIGQIIHEEQARIAAGLQSCQFQSHSSAVNFVRLVDGSTKSYNRVHKDDRKQSPACMDYMNMALETNMTYQEIGKLSTIYNRQHFQR